MDKLKELLGEELFNQVTEKLGDTKVMIDDGNFIPKSRFDEVNEQKKEFKTMLDDRDKQLKDLETKAKGNEELEKQIKELQETNQKTTEEYEEKIKKINFESKLKDKIEKDYKGKNYKAIKALLNLETITLDGDRFIGLEEQMASIKETDSYLLGEDKLGGREPNPTDKTPSTGVTKEQFNSMSYKERLNLYNENKELYEKLND